jgi:cytochrome c oxidase cbb3-type subunit 3
MTHFFIFLMCAGIAAAQSPKRVNPLGGASGVVAAGRKLYNTTCTICHGPDGAEGERGPALAATRRYFRLSENAVFDAIRNGIPGSAMPASGLPDPDVWRIVAFIRALRGTASDSPPEGDPENGRRVFATKGRCLECHTIRGEGGFLGPDLSNLGGERNLAHIRDALTKPRPLAKAYRSVKLTTADGRTLSGIAKNEDAFSIQLLGRDHKIYLLDRAELREVIHEEKSIMPDDYDKTLTPLELRDLLAYLSRQVRHRKNIEQPGGNEVGR